MKQQIRSTWNKVYSGTGKTLLIVIVFLVVIRLLLPSVIKYYINRQLDKSKEYTGWVNDVDLSLWRGAYQIEGIHILKRGSDIPVPFVSVESLDISVYWKQLFHRRIVAQIKMDTAQVNFVDDVQKEKRQFGFDMEWLDLLDSFAPLQIDRFTLLDSSVHFQRFDSSPNIDVQLRDIYGEVTNLTNTSRFSGSRVAKAWVKGNLGKGGSMEVKTSLNPFQKGDDFDVDFRMEKVPLTYLNGVLKEYAKFDVDSGIASVYAELYAENKKIEGYFKPLLWDVSVLSWGQDVKTEKDSPFRLLWEGMVGATSGILRNQPQDQIATKVSIAGSLENPKIKPFRAFINILKNAFIRAFVPKFDHNVGAGKKKEPRPEKKKSTLPPKNVYQ